MARVAKKDTTVFMGTGRRKTSIARVRIMPGKGNFTINGKDINDYLNNQSIEIKNLEIRYSDYNKEYYLDFSTNIGNNYFMIDFKIENNKIVYNDKILKNIDWRKR